MRALPAAPTWLKRTVTALALAAVAGGIASTPAMADDDWHDGRGRGHERHEWREHHARAYYPPPRVIYTPPPAAYYVPPPAVYYAPPPPRVVYVQPPVVYAPPPTLSIILPLHF